MKKTESTPIRDVSDTAFWVAHYRAEESVRGDGMFRDPFAKQLVGERGNQIAAAMADIGPYVRWSVLTRTVIIDRFIEKLLSEGCDAVVNLGAGLDARPYRLPLPASLEWIEADHPAIIRHKTRVLANSEPGCKLTRVEVDLANDRERTAFLENVAPHSRKVVIVTEGVIPYLTPAQVSALGRDLQSQHRFAYWIAEYFHPRVYRYLRHPVRTSKLKNAPFRFFPEDWFGFFREIGWSEKETRYFDEIGLEFGRKPPMPTLVRVFMKLLPRKVREELARSTGFVILEKDRFSSK